MYGVSLKEHSEQEELKWEVPQSVKWPAYSLYQKNSWSSINNKVKSLWLPRMIELQPQLKSSKSKTIWLSLRPITSEKRLKNDYLFYLESQNFQMVYKIAQNSQYNKLNRYQILYKIMKHNSLNRSPTRFQIALNIVKHNPLHNKLTFKLRPRLIQMPLTTIQLPLET